MRVDFTASNNADWRREFSLTRRASGTPPWSLVAEWDSEGTYGSGSPASVVKRLGDLYVAKAGATITEGVFLADEWVRIGIASLYTAEPVDLTNAELTMRLAPVQADALTVDVDASVLALTTENGGLFLSSPSQGGVSLFLPVAQARGQTAGRYAYDLVAFFDDGRVERLMIGFITIEQGIS